MGGFDHNFYGHRQEYRHFDMNRHADFGCRHHYGESRVFNNPFGAEMLANQSYNHGYTDGTFDANYLYNGIYQDSYPMTDPRDNGMPMDCCNNNQQQTAFMTGMMTGLALILVKLGINNNQQQIPEEINNPQRCEVPAPQISEQVNNSQQQAQPVKPEMSEKERFEAKIKELENHQVELKAEEARVKAELDKEQTYFKAKQQDPAFEARMAQLKDDQKEAPRRGYIGVPDKPVTHEASKPEIKHKPKHTHKVAKKVIHHKAVEKPVHQEIKPAWSTNAWEHAQEMIDKISNPVESPWKTLEKY